MQAKSCIFAFMAMICGCVSGIEPPGPTTLVTVKGGKFLFGSTAACYNAGADVKVTCAAQTASGLPKVYPAVLVALNDFAIEEHEVTNFQYEYCVAMGKCPSPTYTNASDITDYFGNQTYRRYPVVNVTWDMARAYCEFVGRRLPTEIEWERVAAGAEEEEKGKRAFPFLNGADAIEKCNGKAVAIRYCNGLNRPSAVMSSSDDFVQEGEVKIWDIAGNVAEWVGGFWKEGITCAGEINQACDCFGCGADAQCTMDCYVCDDCWDGAAGKDNGACYRECPSEKHPGYPVCKMQPAGTVVPPDSLMTKQGAERFTRGGAFTDDKNATCRAASADRNRHIAASMSHTAYGFRCAMDL